MSKIRYTILLWALLPWSVWAYDFQVGHLFYSIVDSQAVEVCYEYPDQVVLYKRLRKLTIPAQVTYEDRTYQVVGIGKRAFHDCPKLRRIKMPESLLYIDSAALAHMSSLDSLTLPSHLRRIGDEAFYRCTSLSYIDLPASVDSIGENIFLNCNKLRRITVDPFNMRYDSREECNGIVETSTGRLFATSTRTTIPNKLTWIGSQAFAYRSNLQQAIIPEGVETIGYAAFAGCIDLDTVSLPSTLDSLGEWAFYGCQSLRHIDLPQHIKRIPYNCFAECNSLREITIPDAVDSLAERAFYFSGLQVARLPRVRYIGYSCFAGCRFLHTIYLSANLQTIEPAALENCMALERIYVPFGHRKRIQKLLPKIYHKLIIEQ